MWRTFVDDPYLISQKMPHFSPKVKSALASKMLSVTILISRREKYSANWTNLSALCWVMVCGGASHSCICCNLASSSPFRSLLRHPDESCWGAECNCQASAVLFVFFLWQCSTCPALPGLRFQFPVHTTNHHASLPCGFGEGPRNPREKESCGCCYYNLHTFAYICPVWLETAAECLGNVTGFLPINFDKLKCEWLTVFRHTLGGISGSKDFPRGAWHLDHLALDVPNSGEAIQHSDMGILGGWDEHRTFATFPK